MSYISKSHMNTMRIKAQLQPHKSRYWITCAEQFGPTSHPSWIGDRHPDNCPIRIDRGNESPGTRENCQNRALIVNLLASIHKSGKIAA